MPKINVYLPDELAEAVKETGVPVSAVCQRALELAVRRVTALRASGLGGLSPQDLETRLSHFTAKARGVLSSAADLARGDGSDTISTGHLLGGLLGVPGNLALAVLGAMEIEPAQVARDVASLPAGGEPVAAKQDAPQLSGPAVNALELAVTESTAMGHNYVGCEHLLLGLVTEPDGVAGQVLRALGAEARPTRRAVVAALAGFVHRSAPSGPAPTTQALAAAIRQELQPLIQRIERLEQHAG